MNNFIMRNHWMTIIFLIMDAPVIFSMEGGTEAVAGQFNYFVSIWHHYEHVCSGVIIDGKHVLNAGSCLRDISASDLRIFAGMNNLADPNIQILEVASFWRHPGSRKVVDASKPSKVYWTNDIAIIRLSHEFIWSPSIGRVIATGRDDNWDVSQECVMLGWHNTMTNGQREMSLKWTHGVIMEEEDYLPLNTYLLRNEQALRAPVVMNRDYGSPLICGDSMTGLLVRGGETVDDPITVLRITPYYEFITIVINDAKTDIKLDEFRYVVSIWHYETFMCGGVIIDRLRILTAAHCIPTKNQPKLRVFAGRSIVDVRDLRIEIESTVLSIQKHPLFKKIRRLNGRLLHSRKNDIAVLKLENPLTWKATVGPGILRRANNAPTLFCRVLRWQHTKINNTTTSIKLMWSAVVISDPSNFNDMSLSENEFIVAGGNSLSVSNPEDSGNPVVCNGVVIGIVVDNFITSLGWPSVPTVVLETSNYIDFIKSSM